MSRKILPNSLLLMMLLLSACGSVGSDSNASPLERQSIIDLVCGLENQAECIASICESADNCPLFSALTDKAVFDFVGTYSACEDCTTPDLAPGLGIGKCIQYQVTEISSGWSTTFWVSDNCSFRYGSPSKSRIRVDVHSGSMQIERITPPSSTSQTRSIARWMQTVFACPVAGCPFSAAAIDCMPP